MTAEWIPPDVDSEKPSVARVYDYLLGGTHNFASDRDLATGLLRIEPQARELAKANRAFLRRAVRVMVDSGVHQFIDIGSGIPTVGNVHEVAQASDRSSRVVYVDNDPVAVAHSRSILAGNEQAAVVQADMRRTAELLDLVADLKLLDLSEPVGILLAAALHLIKDDEDPDAIVAQLRSVMAPGSHLVISHVTDEDRPGKLAAIEKLYRRATSPAVARRRSEVLGFFDGFDLLEPGLVYVPLWRPDVADAADGAAAGADSAERFLMLGGVARLTVGDPVS